MLITAFLVGQALSQAATPPVRPEAELDAITVVGTKTERVQASTPGTITIKTSAALRRELAQSIKDALRYEAGVSEQYPEWLFHSLGK